MEKVIGLSKTLQWCSVQQLLRALGVIWPRWSFCDDSFQDVLLLAVNEILL